jgi:hypothetical protein
MTRELDPGSSVVVSATQLGSRYGKSREWGRKMLMQWWDEQQRGGDLRVFRRGKKGAIYTTIAVLQRHMPPARDTALVRKIESLERDLECAMRRIGQLTDRLDVVERKLLFSGARSSPMR